MAGIYSFKKLREIKDIYIKNLIVGVDTYPKVEQNIKDDLVNNFSYKLLESKPMEICDISVNLTIDNVIVKDNKAGGYYKLLDDVNFSHNKKSAFIDSSGLKTYGLIIENNKEEENKEIHIPYG
ncbi:MAG: hypothetical protein ACOCRK_09925 [bacterium]